MTLSAGARLGMYEILSPLGAGGMGEVYRARDSKLQRDVAIKVLPESLAADAQAMARFEREALAVASLSHPNILAIYDFGSQDNVAYAVMELLEGETLRARLTAGPIPPRQAVDYRLMRIYILIGEPEKALDQLDLLSRIPCDQVSPGLLKIDPTFDPLRKYPRFQKLLTNTT